jgi:hypothetical protein
MLLQRWRAPRSNFTLLFLARDLWRRRPHGYRNEASCRIRGTRTLISSVLYCVSILNLCYCRNVVVYERQRVLAFRLARTGHASTRSSDVGRRSASGSPCRSAGRSPHSYRPVSATAERDCLVCGTRGRTLGQRSCNRTSAPSCECKVTQIHPSNQQHGHSKLQGRRAGLGQGN